MAFIRRYWKYCDRFSRLYGPNTIVITNTLLGTDFMIASRENSDLEDIRDVLDLPIQKRVVCNHHFDLMVINNLHETIHKLNLVNYTAVVIADTQAGGQVVVYKQPNEYPTSRL